MVSATISLNLGEFIERPNGEYVLEDVDITLDSGLLGDIWQEATSRSKVRGYYPLVSSLESRPYRSFRDSLEKIGGTSLVLYQELKGRNVEISYVNGRLVLDKTLVGVDNIPSMVESLVKVARCRIKGILSKGKFYALHYDEDGFDFASILVTLEYLRSLGFDVVPFSTLNIHSVEELDELVIGAMDSDMDDSLGVSMVINDVSVYEYFENTGLWLPYKFLSSKVYKGYVQFVNWCEDMDGVLRPFAYISDLEDVVKFHNSKGEDVDYYTLIHQEGFSDMLLKVKNFEDLGVRTVGARIVKYVPLHNIATMVQLGVNYQSKIYFRVYKSMVFPTDENGRVLFDTFDL